MVAAMVFGFGEKIFPALSPPLTAAAVK